MPNRRRSVDRRGLFAAAIAAALEPLEGRAMMSTTYYVSPSGNDANAGTSASAPWKTIAKVNSEAYSPGTQILFQGGQTFAGAIEVFNGGGTTAAPVVFGSYGSGRATLSAGSSDGIWVYNRGGVTIENLILVGTNNGGSNQDGIRLESNGGSLGAVTVTGCDVSGFYAAGICLLGDYGNHFASATITDNTLHGNVVSGLVTYSDNNAMPDVVIEDNTAYDNNGVGGLTNSGDGFMMAGLEGAMVSHNVAYDNGIYGSGGCGIWCYDSDRVTFEYNASFGNMTTGVDGDGFDFDANTSNSVMEYNYAANNDGGGFMIDQWYNDSTQTGDVIRYNVAQNNGHAAGYGNIDIWGKVIDAQIYGNTVYTSASNNASAVRITNETIPTLFADGVHFADNIFYTTGGAPELNLPAAMLDGSTGITFDGNDWYSSGYSANIKYGNSTYASLAAFQAGTGQEKVSGVAVGSSANPLLVGAGSGGTSISTSTSLASYLSSYQLQSSSPITKSGVDLATVLGVTPTGTDFYGDAVSAATVTPGADTAASSTAAVAAATPTPTVTPTATTTPTATPTPTPTTTTTSTGQLTGTTYGTVGSFDGNKATTITAATDGNLNTYFDAPTATGGNVGINLGSAKVVGSIKYAPRSGFASRMVGGMFQVSTSPTFASNVTTVYTITAAPATGVLTTVTLNVPTAYQYWRYIGPANGYCDIAEFQLYAPTTTTTTPTTPTPTPTTTSTGQLTGTTYGTVGSFDGNKATTITAATDGNLNTYFDAPTATGGNVGINLGSAKVVGSIKYAPRSGFASRMVGGMFQVSTSPTFASNITTVYTITAAPATGVLTTVTLNVPTAYQYWRYIGPANGYCDIAEFQLFAASTTTAAVAQLTGTTYGTVGSFDNNAATTTAAATDDNLNTYFDAPTASGGNVGINLGSAQTVTEIKFAPRSGFASRMVGGMFQVSTSATFSSNVTTVYTITSTPVTGSLTTISLNLGKAYQYWRYIGPTGGYCDIAEFELFGT